MSMSILYPNNGYNGKGGYHPKSVSVITHGIRHYAAMPDQEYWARIRARMKELRVTQADVAAYLKLPSQSAVSNLMKGTRKLGAREKIDLEHLLRIEGESNVQRVPIIGFTQAGQWREAVQLPLGYLPLLAGIAGRNAFAVEVKGDSMDLFIRDGGYAVVDPEQRNLHDGSVYMLQNDDYETTIKLYRNAPARFCPMSSNPEHTEFAIGDHRFIVIGKVVWTGSRAP